MNFSDIKKYIQAWLVTSSGLPDNHVIFDYQNSPKPGQTFITLTPSRIIRDLGRGEMVDNHDGTATTYQGKEVSMSINVYGKDAEDIMILVLDSLKLPLTIQNFDSKDISVVNDGNIRDLTFIEENQYQNRRQLDLITRFTTSITQTVGYFDTVNISSNDLAPDFDNITEPVLSLELTLETDTDKISPPITKTTITHESPNNHYSNALEMYLGTNLSSSNIYEGPVVDLEIDLNSTIPENTTALVQTLFPPVKPVISGNVNNVSGSSVITWSSTDSVDSFKLYITDNTTSTYLSGYDGKVVSGSTFSETVTGLTDSHSYTFEITATAHNIDSELSEPLTFTYTDELIYSVPVSSSASNPTNSGFTANFTPTGSPDNLKIYISPDNFATSSTFTLSPTSTSYTPTGLIANTPYKYKLTGIINGVETAFSAVQTISTLPLIILAEKIIFAENVPGFPNHQIKSMNSDGSGKVNLSNNGSIYDDTDPCISPDGTKIAFIRTYSGSWSDLWIMNYDGSNKTNVTNFANGLCAIFPSWHPNGSKIVFQYRVGDYYTGHNYVYTINANGTGLTLILDVTNQNNCYPRYNIDGSHISLTYGTGLAHYNLSNSVLTPIRDGNAYWPDWHPTNPNKITYIYGVPGVGIPYQIWMKDLGTNTETQLTSTSTLLVQFPNWSLNGNEIVYCEYSSGYAVIQLKKVNVSTLAVTDITNNTSINNEFPFWSNLQIA